MITCLRLTRIAYEFNLCANLQPPLKKRRTGLETESVSFPTNTENEDGISVQRKLRLSQFEEINEVCVSNLCAFLIMNFNS